LPPGDPQRPASRCPSDPGSRPAFAPSGRPPAAGEGSLAFRHHPFLRHIPVEVQPIRQVLPLDRHDPTLALDHPLDRDRVETNTLPPLEHLPDRWRAHQQKARPPAVPRILWQPGVHAGDVRTLGKDVIAVTAGPRREPPVRPGLGDPLVPEDPVLFAVCGRERVVIITHQLIRALPPVAHPGHLSLDPGEGGDVIGELLALQLPADKANGDDDPPL
jgi:hypothetical protein